MRLPRSVPVVIFMLGTIEEVSIKLPRGESFFDILIVCGIRLSVFEYEFCS